MLDMFTLEASEKDEQSPSSESWASRAMLLWQHRHLLVRVTALATIAGLAIAFAIPRQYRSVASIMPPDQQGTGAMMLAALEARTGGLGGLSGLASGLLGTHSSTALFINLLRSSTVSDRIIDRFQLQHVYRKRYRVDTAKHLAHITTIMDDKKSGVITIQVEDTNPVRARDLAQGYLDELNELVVQTNTSAAHRERVFIEQRLHSVNADLEQAQIALSNFSSQNSTVDLKEETRAIVDAGARVEGELLVEQSGLQSLRQIYGDGNVRVRETEARTATLRRELQKMTGSPDTPTDSSQQNSTSGDDDKAQLYPPLRQLPRLGVTYADLYRRVRVQETVFELLTQQFEIARIDEAKDVPAVSVIDPPGIPEKKSFPPRLFIALSFGAFSFALTSALILARDRWSSLHPGDPRKELAAAVIPVLCARFHRLFPPRRGAA